MATTRLSEHDAAAIQAALTMLDTMTSDDFSKGADRPVRRTLVQLLAAGGVWQSDDVLREYGVAQTTGYR